MSVAPIDTDFVLGRYRKTRTTSLSTNLEVEDDIQSRIRSLLVSHRESYPSRTPRTSDEHLAKYNLPAIFPAQSAKPVRVQHSDGPTDSPPVAYLTNDHDCVVPFVTRRPSAPDLKSANKWHPLGTNSSTDNDGSLDDTASSLPDCDSPPAPATIRKPFRFPLVLQDKKSRKDEPILASWFIPQYQRLAGQGSLEQHRLSDDSMDGDRPDDYQQRNVVVPVDISLTTPSRDKTPPAPVLGTEPSSPSERNSSLAVSRGVLAAGGGESTWDRDPSRNSNAQSPAKFAVQSFDFAYPKPEHTLSTSYAERSASTDLQPSISMATQAAVDQSEVSAQVRRSSSDSKDAFPDFAESPTTEPAGFPKKPTADFSLTASRSSQSNLANMGEPSRRESQPLNEAANRRQSDASSKSMSLSLLSRASKTSARHALLKPTIAAAQPFDTGLPVPPVLTQSNSAGSALEAVDFSVPMLTAAGLAQSSRDDSKYSTQQSKNLGKLSLEKIGTPMRIAMPPTQPNEPFSRRGSMIAPADSFERSVNLGKRMSRTISPAKAAVTNDAGTPGKGTPAEELRAIAFTSAPLPDKVNDLVTKRDIESTGVLPPPSDGARSPDRAHRQPILLAESRKPAEEIRPGGVGAFEQAQSSLSASSINPLDAAYWGFVPAVHEAVQTAVQGAVEQAVREVVIPPPGAYRKVVADSLAQAAADADTYLRRASIWTNAPSARRSPRYVGESPSYTNLDLGAVKYSAPDENLATPSGQPSSGKFEVVPLDATDLAEMQNKVSSTSRNGSPKYTPSRETNSSFVTQATLRHPRGPPAIPAEVSTQQVEESFKNSSPNASPDERLFKKNAIQWLRELLSNNDAYAPRLTELPPRTYRTREDDSSSSGRVRSHTSPTKNLDRLFLGATPNPPNGKPTIVLTESPQRSTEQAVPTIEEPMRTPQKHQKGAAETFTKTINDLELLMSEALQIARQAADRRESIPYLLEGAADLLKGGRKGLLATRVDGLPVRARKAHQSSTYDDDTSSVTSMHESLRDQSDASLTDGDDEELDDVGNGQLERVSLLLPKKASRKKSDLPAPKSPVLRRTFSPVISVLTGFGSQQEGSTASNAPQTESGQIESQAPAKTWHYTKTLEMREAEFEVEDAKFRRTVGSLQDRGTSHQISSPKEEESVKPAVIQDSRGPVNPAANIRGRKDKLTAQPPAIKPRKSSLAVRSRQEGSPRIPNTAPPLDLDATMPSLLLSDDAREQDSVPQGSIRSLDGSVPSEALEFNTGFHNELIRSVGYNLPQSVVPNFQGTGQTAPGASNGSTVFARRPTASIMQPIELIPLRTQPAPRQGGAGVGSSSLFNLKGKRHISLREHKGFSLSRTHKRKPIARDWSPGRKRFVATAICLSTWLVGIVIGIYAGMVPSIQYTIVDFHHYAVLGNVFFYIALSIPTFIFWPLPLLHGRKPYIVGSMSLAMPLLFPQALTLGEIRSPYVATWRVALILPRTFMGLVLGFAQMNFLNTLMDLFGASLQSENPHQEVVDVNDVRRHGGGMGVWLGIWTWCYIGSIGLGFMVGCIVINWLQPSWGFYISIVILAVVLFLNVVTPEVRRSAFRRSVAEARTENSVSRRLGRGEVKMHRKQTGPKWWGEEVKHGMLLSRDMLKQPGFLLMAVYVGWVYGQNILMMVLVGSLTSNLYKLKSPYVGLCVAALPLGAICSIPFQKAGLFSRERTEDDDNDQSTFAKQVSWSSHMVRRAIFILVLPLLGIAYTVASGGPPTPVAVPVIFTAGIGFLSNLAIAECHGIIMEAFDTSDLQPGMTGRPRGASGARTASKRTNYSSFPRVAAGFGITQGFGFLIAALSTGVGGVVTRNIGQKEATGVMAGILMLLSILLLSTLVRFQDVQIIPDSKTEHMERWQNAKKNNLQRRATGIEEEEPWRPVVIGNPTGTTRRMNLLEMGSMSRFSEIRKKNRLIDAMSREALNPNLVALEQFEERLHAKKHQLADTIVRSVSNRSRASLCSRKSNEDNSDPGDLGGHREMMSGNGVRNSRSGSRNGALGSKKARKVSVVDE